MRWDNCERWSACGEPALVLRRTRTACAAQDEGYETLGYARRLMVSSVAKPRVRRTMRDESQRISITLALEPRRAHVRQAFEVGEHRDEGADAGEEFEKGSGAPWPVEGRALAHPEAHLRDLAGAAADGEVERGLVVDDNRLEVHPRLGAVRERVKTVRGERLAHQVRHLLLQRPHALTHRVVRE